MGKFNYDALKEEPGAVRPYTFHELPNKPTLDCRPATSANKKFHSARLAAIDNRVKTQGQGGLSVDSLEADRLENIDLWSTYCVTGWGPAPLEANGVESPFSTDNCKDFLEAIPERSLNAFQGWIQAATNFLSPGEIAAPDAGEEAGKSSPLDSSGG